ncbi:5'/3'-nucleotidase SurE [Thiomicrorhabdus sp.]|uniref:5'/3'-nucleotidase SurE n=1 Tax=Thiomicrorhabdus sp. TaxID=2039724 RepID=UPI0029C82D43|nr:5'/3'-nucleotidase SurE [Thiomicrorhabdus sp.]
MRLKYLPLLAAAFATPSYALNIVIANDDSYETANVQQLKLKLEEAGHNVLLSVPCAHQSGKGGSMGSYMTNMPVHKLEAGTNGILSVNDDTQAADGYCVGDLEADKATKTFQEFKDGTPLIASAHGIYKANEIWGTNPDLLISGPNEGRNVGFAVFISGTLGAAHQAIVSGIPAIAISAGSTPGDEADALTYAKTIGSMAVDIVEKLQASRKDGEALLPPKMGLNVNTPDFGKLAGAEYKFTDVNWNSGMAIQWSNLGEGYGGYYGYTTEMGLYGLNFMPSNPTGDVDPNSEANAVDDGYIAISTIDATENAIKAKSDLQ